MFVIAGNYEQAVRWAREHGVRTRDLVYLSSPEDAVFRAMGRRDEVYVCVGTWQDKPAWQLTEMFAVLISRGFRRADESEWEAARHG